MTIDNFLRRLPFVGGGRNHNAEDDSRDAARTLDPREEKRRLEASYAPAPRMEYAPEPTAPPPHHVDDAAADDDAPPHSRRFLSQPWRQRTPEERRDLKKRAKKCCKRSVRYLFFVFNVVLLIFGGALLGAAVWIRGQTAEFFEVERNESDMVRERERRIPYAL